MQLSQLERLQSNNVRPLLTQTETLLAGYTATQVSPSLWRSLMVLLFQLVFPASVRSGEYARAFYDAERERVFPGIPRNDVYRAELTFEQFLEDMSEVYPLFRRKRTEPHEVRRAALRVARTVENTARYTTIKAVESDDPYLDDLVNDSPSSVRFVDSEDEFTVEYQTLEERNEFRKRNKVKTWARVATGAETCGWCLMLCSRGPVYRTEASSGGMTAWHDGCDCKVVPVFDLLDWSGRDRYLAAEEMWKDVTKGLSGKDAIAAMRKAASEDKFQEYLNK